jgi:AcrR family transcriptional regulator
VESRRDAVRNRSRILAAAELEFRAGGVSIPLDRVAQRAGVGRGTLYRHFPDRRSLIAAMYTARVEALEALAGELSDGRLLEQLAAEICAQQVAAPGLFGAVHAAEDPAIAQIEGRGSALLERALSEASAEGRVRPDVTADDIRLLFAMSEGVVATSDPRSALSSARRAVVLALRGILRDPPDELPAPRLPDPVETHAT